MLLLRTYMLRPITPIIRHTILSRNSSSRLLSQTDSSCLNHPTPKSNESAEESLLDIESNLFANSDKCSKPVQMNQLLEKFKVPNKFTRTRKQKAVDKKNGQPLAASIVSTPPQLLPKPPLVQSSIIYHKELNLNFKKLHFNDPWLQRLMVMVKSKKHRFQKHQLLIEGRRLIIDALSAGLNMEYLLFSDIEQLKLIKEHLRADTQIVKVPQSDLSFWSNLSTCPGIMGIFVKPPNIDELCNNNNGLPITVICDQIREPNNLGSIIRIGAAVPCSQIVVMKGCADPWESKTLRGGAGAHFRIPIKGPIEWSSVQSFLPEFFSVYIAENNEKNMRLHLMDDSTVAQPALKPYSDVVFDTDMHNVIVIGGETHGVSAEAYAFLQENQYGSCVHIPLAAGVDSLNTASALAIVLFELRKRILARPTATHENNVETVSPIT